MTQEVLDEQCDINREYETRLAVLQKDKEELEGEAEQLFRQQVSSQHAVLKL